MRGTAYLHKATGKWLVLNERTTHTGRHVDIRFSDQMNEAYVGAPLTYAMAPKVPDLDLGDLVAVEAVVEVVRTVTLV